PTLQRPHSSTLFPYTTLFRSLEELGSAAVVGPGRDECGKAVAPRGVSVSVRSDVDALSARSFNLGDGFRHASPGGLAGKPSWGRDRKSTRLNSSHSQISYAVF